MKTFEYDPNRTFRGWLRRLCESRVCDSLRQQRAASRVSFDERMEQPESAASGTAVDADLGDDEGDDDPRPRFLLAEGEKVQAAVRAKVTPRTWEAFWLIAVCDWSDDRPCRRPHPRTRAVLSRPEAVQHPPGG
jgi:DNA-directed RNA polymerase specialized sigma24 family protein